jgi:hypothetical protein
MLGESRKSRIVARRSSFWYNLDELLELQSDLKDRTMTRSIEPSRIEVVDDQMAEILRQKTPAERVAMIGAANRTARLLAEAGARHLHPDWTDAQIHADVLRRVCGGAD